MRTTVTLDPDVEQAVRDRMRRQKVGFKQALNDAIRAGLAPAEPDVVPTRPMRLGEPRVDLAHGLRVVADLEDDELIRKADRGA